MNDVEKLLERMRDGRILKYVKSICDSEMHKNEYQITLETDGVGWWINSGTSKANNFKRKKNSPAELIALIDKHQG